MVFTSFGYDILYISTRLGCPDKINARKIYGFLDNSKNKKGGRGKLVYDILYISTRLGCPDKINARKIYGFLDNSKNEKNEKH